MRAVSQVREPSDHYMYRRQMGTLARPISKYFQLYALTWNFRGLTGGVGGKRCLSEIVRRKSCTAGLVVGRLRDGCIAWTFGSNSETVNEVGSNGKLGEVSQRSQSFIQRRLKMESKLTLVAKTSPVNHSRGIRQFSDLGIDV